MSIFAFTISVGQATIVKPLATATFCAPFAVLGDHVAAEALAPKFFAGGGFERIVCRTCRTDLCRHSGPWLQR